VATLKSSSHSIIIANGGGDKCLMLIGLFNIDIASTTRCWVQRRIDIHRHCHFRHPTITRRAVISALRNILIVNKISPIGDVLSSCGRVAIELGLPLPIKLRVAAVTSRRDGTSTDTNYPTLTAVHTSGRRPLPTSPSVVCVLH